MANPWFRLYSELANDPKIQMMSEANQRRFIMILCIRCSNGDVTLHDEEVAFQLRISNEEWLETKKLFIAKNLIDEDNKPVAWEKRQYASDSSAARVAKHREKVKQQCNVTVTPPDTDTDTDTDTEHKKQTPKAASPFGFAEFWLAYPKKVGKGAAEKSWKRLRPELKTVLQAIELAKRSEQWQKNGGEFIPHPATWLNQKRWDDEIAPVAVSQGSAKPWFLSWTGIVQEGERMGIERNPGEIDPAYKARVLQAANITQDTIRKAQQDFAGVAA